jgi:signal transduction histidine kinase
MSTAARAAAFRRFGNPEAKGSGLGLAIVQAIAERHHARITLAERDSGPGLVVRLTFPRL